MVNHNDWHNDQPWMHLFQLGLRTDFIWAPRFLEAECSNYWNIYWDPTPGASVTWDDGEQALDPRFLVLIPAGFRFKRRYTAPVDHWFAHVRVGAEPARREVVALEVDATTATLLRQAWTYALERGPASPQSVTSAYAVIGWALSKVDWAIPSPIQEDQRLRELDLNLRRQNFPQLSNAEMGELLGMTAKSFLRWFQRRTGQSPQNWLRDRRTERAAQLLSEGQTLEQVVHLCGFTDGSHLNRLFQRRYKTTPGYYARLHRTQTDPT